MKNKQAKLTDRIFSAKSLFWISLLGILSFIVVVNLLGYLVSESLATILTGLVIVFTFYMFIPEPELIAQFIYSVWNVFFLLIFILTSLVLSNLNGYIKKKKGFKYLVSIGIGCFYIIVCFFIIQQFGKFDF